MIDLMGYRTWLFDCDGVVLNSNRIKTDAFFRAAEPYGAGYAQQLVDYHVQNGGVSRYVKFQRFLTDIVGRKDYEKEELDRLLADYAGFVEQGLLSCEVAPGLDRLRALTQPARWFIVSGGDQEELRSVFRQRGLDALFDGGIYGSPSTKDDILAALEREGVVDSPAVFIGDSQYDFESARRAGLDFVFVSDWSESAFDFKDADLKRGSLAELVSQF
ncbi:HAD family hydrolase [Marinobacter daepoensis]|uniref:HAD family hydrolase n=1 Tax=Marinobacter daepoensis TaxID=262077 RepID=UPI0003FBD0DC|nr:HAD-IA family hydrolase [Marinobacter daepoensis]